MLILPRADSASRRFRTVEGVRLRVVGRTTLMVRGPTSFEPRRSIVFRRGVVTNPEHRSAGAGRSLIGTHFITGWPAGPGDQAADPHGPRGSGLAGLLPRRRRAHLRQAGPEGGRVLRRRAPRGRPARAGRHAAARPEPLPGRPEGFREAVLEYMAALTGLGHRLRAGLALSLGLEESYFADHGTAEPLTLFRIFNYPPPADPSLWGVGEHTDYGLLTILYQDDAGGLEVRSRSGWVSAPPVSGSFVCNIGDMLDLMTRGLYRSTPHRVRNPAPRARLSLPFFFDPNFFARMRPLDLPGVAATPDDRDERWDRASVHAFEGTYGDYLLNKVGKVFPELRSAVL